MKLGLLFSGGKDSTYAGWLAEKHGHKLSCLISIISKNPESFMFHTPSIKRVEKQASAMKIPIVLKKTRGEKEAELDDLDAAIARAISDYKIEGVVTGAVESVYQATRIQKICAKHKIECFNPLWQKNQIELLNELIKNKFEVIITGISAYPLDDSWLGRVIDKNFIEEVEKLQKKYDINPAGEGGEFETFVLNCPLFKKKLNIIKSNVFGEKNSWRLEMDVE